MIVIDLIFNLALLISVSVLSGFVDRRYRRDTYPGVILQGLLFGMVAILGMLNPFILIPGIIFDGRSVVLSLCGLFFGPFSGLIAGIIALSYRVFLGGSGVYMGVFVIISSTLIGVLFHRYYKTKQLLSKTGFLYGVGLVVHIVMVLMMVLIPSPMRMIAFSTVSLTILGVYPVATALIGKILQDQADSTGLKDAELALQESENRFALFMDHLPAFAFIKDSEFKSIYVNKHMDEVLGASAWIGLTPPEFFPGDFGLKLMADDQQALDSGLVKIEEKVPDISGEARYYETQKFLIPQAGRKPLLGGISIDITDRKMAAQSLKEKTLELERFNNLMIGRELKMIELKKEINDMLVQHGDQAKYIIHG